jgi:2-polyprenyl-3-methyl-5-hydroxy-6-metoxy-1,4-benzoquinol methylase
MDDYLKINKTSWNSKVQTHVDSDFYDVKSFLEGKSSLTEIDLELLGTIEGKKILHLQCHFGMDTISLSRLGAYSTGIDFSEEAILKAQELANQTGSNSKFLVSDVYSLPEVLEEKYDMVYTSFGVVGWLPDLKKWAEVIHHFLKPGGELVFAEFHPVIWMFDDDFEEVKYSYFKEEPIVEICEGTYANPDAPIVNHTMTWNHAITEIVESLIGAGLEIIKFKEYNYSPYPCFRHIEEFEEGKWRIEKFGNKIPMVYALKAKKR